MKLNVAMNSDNFFIDIEKIKTNKIDRYKNNSGRLHFSSLNYNKFTTVNIKQCREEFPDFSASSRVISQKIIDWNVRNDQAKLEYDMQDEIVSYDTESDVFDSVSVFHQNSYRPVMPKFDIQEQQNNSRATQRSSQQTLNSIPPSITETIETETDDQQDDSDINYIRACGTNRGKLTEKYKCPPRKPNTPFEIGLAQHKNAPIMTSEYQQKLLQKKKKLMAKVQANSNTFTSLDEKSSGSSTISNSTDSQTNSIPKSILSKYAQQRSQIVNKLQKCKISSAAESRSSNNFIPTSTESCKNISNNKDTDVDDRVLAYIKSQQDNASANKKVINFIPAGFDQGRITEDIVDRNAPPKVSKSKKGRKTTSDSDDSFKKQHTPQQRYVPREKQTDSSESQWTHYSNNKKIKRQNPYAPDSDVSEEEEGW